jgi:hypothetical protein
MRIDIKSLNFRIIPISSFYFYSILITFFKQEVCFFIKSKNIVFCKKDNKVYLIIKEMLY